MNASIKSIAPLELELLRQEGSNFELIDVRTPAEFRLVHAEPAHNVPLEELGDDELQQIAARAGRHPIYVICQSGARGRAACQKLRGAGIDNVHNVEGGTAAWEAAELPVVRGQGVISLERQVRIGVGLMVLASAILAYWAHPAWIGLAAFLGAGLIYSGVSGFCGMAILLAKMPWNRGDDRSRAGCASSDGC
jgi:rhodanese-related sulfurtransferase